MTDNTVAPVEIIDASLGALCFFLGLERLITGRVITPENFLAPISTTPAEGVRVNPVRYTDRDLQIHAYNTKIIMVGTTSIAVDDALTEFFGEKNRESNSEIGQIHAVIHQVRNCFAHKPLDPVWRIYPKYRRVYSVRLPNGNKRAIDLRGLSETQFKLGDIGGLNILIGMFMSAHDEVESQTIGE